VTSARQTILLGIIALSALSCATQPAGSPAVAAKRTMADVLAASTTADWRAVDPANTLYLDLASGGRVIIELALQFAPNHANNIQQLARQGFYDGLAINRVQDNFVVQWGDADNSRSVGTAQKTLPPEFTRPMAGLAFTALPDGDGFALEAGFVEGFPAGRDAKSGTAWLAHCYGMVGVGRDNAADSGGGTELYVVIGHAPRQLDRNITVAGRVLRGMELLASLPRGTGAMGFYEKVEQRVAVRSIRRALDVPATERVSLEALRTDTATFAALIEARRNRSDDWYLVKAGFIDLCNVPLPVREAAPR
jgi:peptidylprolyl isomerase